MELCAILCGSLDGRGIWVRMDTCTWKVESLWCSLETATTLLIGYTPVQNKKLGNKQTKNQLTSNPLHEGFFLWSFHFISILWEESCSELEHESISVAPYLDYALEIVNTLETVSNIWNKSYYLYEVKIYLPEIPLGRPSSQSAQSLQSCPTTCSHMNYSPLGSSVHGFLQARILEWVAMPFSRGSSQPRDWTCVFCVSCIAGGFFTTEPPEKLPLGPYSTQKRMCQLLLLSESVLMFNHSSSFPCSRLILISLN